MNGRVRGAARRSMFRPLTRRLHRPRVGYDDAASPSKEPSKFERVRNDSHGQDATPVPCGARPYRRPARTASDTLELVDLMAPDVVLLSVGMPDPGRMATLRLVHASRPDGRR